MIVKNEAHGIVETLESLRPFTDRWTILDTGSTDGTQELIKKTLAEVPGELHEEPFVDFSTSRNRALDLHGAATTFTIMPDSDDRLIGGEALRVFCTSKCDTVMPDDEAYLVNIRRGELSYYLPLILRTAAGWRYKGRVHEFSGRPGGQPASVRIPRAVVTQQPKSQSLEASRARWSRDLELLRADLLADPKNPRTAFYLGQTYECLSRPEDALIAYQHRIELGGWPEETFEAKLRRAKIFDSLKRPWPEIQQAYLDAHAFDPKRAEPLYHIAKYYYGRDEHALVYLFGSRAAALPLPDTSLFVDAEVYEWRIADLLAISGYYLAEKLGDGVVRAASERAAERAMRACPNDERMRSNRAFYVRSAAELFAGYHTQPIAFQPESPYRALNPSVWYDGQRWRCVVRTTNYRLVDGHYITPDGVPIQTRNFMAELSDDLSIEHTVEMIDHDPTPRSSFPVHGFEDCRLFGYDSKLFCTSTACDLNDEHGNREIALLSLDADYSIREAKPLRGPWSVLHQKNWMPLVHDGQVSFIYSTKPEVIFDCRDGEIDVRSTTNFAYGRLRGSSQAVRVPDGWLFLVHDVIWSPGRVYLHRFVLMSDDFKVTRMSDPFYFQQRGIEFCAGLGYDGKQLVASYAVNDHTAHFGVFKLESVLAKLRADVVV